MHIHCGSIVANKNKDPFRGFLDAKILDLEILFFDF